MKRALLLALWTVAGCAGPPASGQDVTLAVFSADVTPPIGHPLCGGMVKPAERVADSLFARGFVLRGGGQRPVLFVALDWTELRNDAYEAWRTALADAAGTSAERVLVHCAHQHDAPYADLEAQRILDQAGLRGFHVDPAFHARALADVAAAVRAARPERVTHVGTGEAVVERIASNRRVVVDGRPTFKRYSRTADPAIRDAPEGLIDPTLKTLSFWSDDRPLAALSLYATHPMSRYGTGAVSADFIGQARARRQSALPQVLQIYATGCSGDVTAGKYNDGRPEPLADRLESAMARAWESTRRVPLDRFDLRVARVSFDVPAVRLVDPAASRSEQLMAALGLSWAKRRDRPVDVPSLDVGAAQLLLLPGEAFVEFQLHAQRIRPEQFVAVAGYGECGPGYIPTESARAEGYVDEHGYCWVAAGAEARLKRAIEEALGRR
ncbi:MAG TPA: hypothetical protein VEJ18_20540 [Planctomycetota bacterium]|nr:hypothetical protein [Planctomycetota bacterium]